MCISEEFEREHKAGWTFKRECPRRPRGITKMWHMLEKLIFLIFRPDIPHDELINVVYFSSSDLLLFSRKFAKMYRIPTARKWRTKSVPSNNTRTSLLKRGKASSFFVNLRIGVGSIDKLFKP